MSKQNCNLLIFAERHHDSGTNQILLGAFDKLKEYGFRDWLFEYEDKNFKQIYNTMHNTAKMLEIVINSGKVLYQTQNYQLNYIRSTLKLIDRLNDDLDTSLHCIDGSYQQSLAERNIVMSEKILEMCSHGKTNLVLRVGVAHRKELTDILKQDFKVLSILSFANPQFTEEQLKLLSTKELQLLYGENSVNEKILHNENVYSRIRHFSQTTIMDKEGSLMLPLDLYENPDININQMITKAISSFGDYYSEL